jgi:hypothetical protein
LSSLPRRSVRMPDPFIDLTPAPSALDFMSDPIYRRNCPG